ncbi:class I lanthipeptide [Psychroserpens luteolus]|uniref:class I lanthipeptide n=1 Tax=Psychroserpens luteolus TaxID=2855840 RepID=UPI00374CE9AD|nr:class I lanthipeptide [Psychroserpens luteolus]
MIRLNKKLQLNKKIVSNLQVQEPAFEHHNLAAGSCLLYSCRTRSNCSETQTDEGDNKTH